MIDYNMGKRLYDMKYNLDKSKLDKLKFDVDIKVSNTRKKTKCDCFWCSNPPKE